jgi:ATP-binding cassette, subfamily B, bacterial PglK
MRSIIPQLMTFVDNRGRLHLLLLLIPMLALAFLEMASVALVLPFIQVLLLGDTNSAAANAIRWLFPAGTEMAIWVGIWFVGLFVVKNFLQLGLIHLINLVMALKWAAFAQRLYESYLRQPLVFHLHRQRSEILRNLMVGCTQAFEGLRMLLLILLDSLMTVGILVLLMLVEPLMTLVAGSSLLAVAYVLQKATGATFLRWGRRGMRYEAQLIELVSQSLLNIRHLKLVHAYPEFGQRFLQIARNRGRYMADSTSAMHVSRLGIELFLVAAFVIGVFGLLERGNPAALLSTLGLFGMASFRLMPSLNRILANLSSLRDRVGYIEELHRDLSSTPPEAKDDAVLDPGRELTFLADIRLEEISYRYPGTERAVLSDINLVIPKGQFVGFVGRSGAGKTTLIDVALGLLKPTAGRVLVDGADISNNLASWQRMIGCVPQEIQLLNDTVRRNVAFGVPDHLIDDDRVREVLQLARLDQVVERLPGGLDVPLGEGGSRLSAGQNQRLAIARALYHDPEVLVLDEATSALDNETESEVTETINALAGQKTVLVIAHRLSTIRSCDVVVYCDAGRVRAVGNFAELQERDADFRRFAMTEHALAAAPRVVSAMSR